ncbi:regulatory protein ToxS [Vibrio sp. RC27]
MPIIRMTALKLSMALILISLGLSGWLYWVSDVKTEQLLTSREWQSRINSFIDYDDSDQKEDSQFLHITINSNVKYLPNNTYIRMSIIKVYNEITSAESHIDISETGTWEISDDYLLISPTEFKDVSTNHNQALTQDQLDIVTQFYKIDAQQSRRIDIINQNTLLLVGLNHESVTLYAHDLP